MNHSKKTGQPEVDEGRGVAQYDFLQTEDECAVNLKQRVVHLLYHQADASDNKTNALANTKGVIVPTIKIGIEAARLQAYAQEHLDKAMKKLKKNKTPPAHSSNIGGGQQQQQQRRSGLLSMFSSSGSWS
mmetsp:Transcript_39183/g.55141  ORF Transcript_39183/g.55141 Transcript_39183/m.55141 type:complete len:130 (+) Transcript_39183:2-391(+)